MVRKNVAEILTNHVTFELEAIDRMYLNAYVPSLQTGGGFVYFVKTQLGARVPSTMMVAPMSERFVEAIERFVDDGGDRSGDVREGPTEGRRRAAVPRDVRGRGGRAVRRQGPREGQRLPHREAARCAREDVSLDHPLDGDAQSLLRLHPRPRLRPALHQVLLLLSVPREALSEWARVAETPADAAGGAVRAVGQRHPLERGARPRAADRRHARRRQDRRGLSQMAAPPAASLRARAPRRRLSLSALDPASRVRADPGPRSAAAPAAVSSKRSSARISTSAVPIRCS